MAKEVSDMPELAFIKNASKCVEEHLPADWETADQATVTTKVAHKVALLGGNYRDGVEDDKVRCSIIVALSAMTEKPAGNSILREAGIAKALVEALRCNEDDEQKARYSGISRNLLLRMLPLLLRSPATKVELVELNCMAAASQCAATYLITAKDDESAANPTMSEEQRDDLLALARGWYVMTDNIDYAVWEERDLIVDGDLNVLTLFGVGYKEEFSRLNEQQQEIASHKVTAEHEWDHHPIIAMVFTLMCLPGAAGKPEAAGILARCIRWALTARVSPFPYGDEAFIHQFLNMKGFQMFLPILEDTDPDNLSESDHAKLAPVLRLALVLSSPTFMKVPFVATFVQCPLWGYVMKMCTIYEALDDKTAALVLRTLAIVGRSSPQVAQPILQSGALSILGKVTSDKNAQFGRWIKVHTDVINSFGVYAINVQGICEHIAQFMDIEFVMGLLRWCSEHLKPDGLGSLSMEALTHLCLLLVRVSVNPAIIGVGYVEAGMMQVMVDIFNKAPEDFKRYPAGTIDTLSMIYTQTHPKKMQKLLSDPKIKEAVDECRKIAVEEAEKAEKARADAKSDSDETDDTADKQPAKPKAEPKKKKQKKTTQTAEEQSSSSASTGSSKKVEASNGDGWVTIVHDDPKRLDPVALVSLFGGIVGLGLAYCIQNFLL